MLAGTSSYELEDFVGAKFYCLHALADGNQRTRIRKKMLEFSLIVLFTLFHTVTLSPYYFLIMTNTHMQKIKIKCLLVQKAD